jgi:hypothetical protein
MPRSIILLLFLACGCSTYTGAQRALIDQAREGLARIEQAHQERAALIESHHAQRRAALDAAFDADARAREAIDAQWVIDARRAYALAIDALHAQRAASAEADRVTRSNIRATRTALEHLQRLVELPLHLTAPQDSKETNHD